MQRIIRITALALAIAFAQGAWAEGHFGAVGGLMHADLPGDSPWNAGVRGGYAWSTGWGIEGEITGSLRDGEARGPFGVEADYSVTTYALYGTYRTQGDVYFKGRAGVIHEEVDVGFVEGSDTGASVGAGVGFAFTDALSLELEYTLVESDVNFWSGAVVLRF